MASALRVKNLAALQREFRQYDRRLQGVVTETLKEVAEPVAAAIRERLSSRFAGVKTSRIRPVVLTGRLVVRQTAGKVTGKRSDFGRTQMLFGFGPVADQFEPLLPEMVGKAFDRMVGDA